MKTEAIEKRTVANPDRKAVFLPAPSETTAKAIEPAMEPRVLKAKGLNALYDFSHTQSLSAAAVLAISL